MRPAEDVVISPATRATALFTADPMPLSDSGTAPSTAEVSGATVMDIPSPTTAVPAAMNTSCPDPIAVNVHSSTPAAATNGPIVMNRRGPNRPASAPKRPESTISSTVAGRPMTAETVAGRCRTCCTYSAGMRNARPIAPYANRVVPFPALKFLAANRLGGTSGGYVQSARTDGNVVRVGLNFKFGAPVAVPVVARY